MAKEKILEALLELPILEIPEDVEHAKFTPLHIGVITFESGEGSVKYVAGRTSDNRLICNGNLTKEGFLDMHGGYYCGWDLKSIKVYTTRSLD